MAGSVSRLSVKPRVPGEVGLPKHAVTLLHLTAAGAEGDYNDFRTTDLNGDPDQAVLVVTEELLVRLAAEGWPIQPGDLGENLTLHGVAESALAPGAGLTIGSVQITITKPCDPCINLYALSYVGKARGPAFLKATAGRRGWYGKVISGGAIETGAGVIVTPALQSGGRPEQPAGGIKR